MISLAGSVGIYRAGEYFFTKQEESSMIIRKETREGFLGKEYYITTQRPTPYCLPLQREYRVQSWWGSTKNAWEELEFFTICNRTIMGWKEPVLWMGSKKDSIKKETE